MLKNFIISFLAFTLVLSSRVYATEEINPNPNPSPNIEIILPSELSGCTDCPEDTFSKVNFLTYAKEKFADKFPFDIVGTIGGGNAGSCTDENICRVRNTLSNFLTLVKYPIWITFLLALVRSI